MAALLGSEQVPARILLDGAQARLMGALTDP